MEQVEFKQAMEQAKKYIDALTISSDWNVPEEIIGRSDRFFTWDNEKRSSANRALLFDWSYYTGVVMEGLFDIYEANPAEGQAYYRYVERYLKGLIVTDEDGSRLDFEKAGYVDYHGADCYKTAALLSRFAKQGDIFEEVAAGLYRDLTDRTRENSKGHIVPLSFTEESLGGNYWHGWSKQPMFKIWLDGIYMLQPFLADRAARIGDAEELARINARLDWVAEELMAPNGLYYHAGNSAQDVCAYFWLRAMGWYGMAMVDVMERLPEEYLPKRIEALKLFADGMLEYLKPEGMWTNLVDEPVTDTNRLETSGTAMISYMLLKAARHGWLPESYREIGAKLFVTTTELKLTKEGLTDIYLRASANNTDNYQILKFYMTDEGKGVGPFIMAYSEMLRI